MVSCSAHAREVAPAASAFTFVGFTTMALMRWIFHSSMGGPLSSSQPLSRQVLAAGACEATGGIALFTLLFCCGKLLQTIASNYLFASFDLLGYNRVI